MALSAQGTVIAIVGDAAEDALATLEGLPGVETLALHDSEPAIAGRRIVAASTPWIVHDADPLGHVAAAWIELYEERATLGALEAEVDAALAQFAAGTALMPDYYIVLEPEDAPDVWRHWWCGALGRHAPQRVLPAHAPATPKDAGIRRLIRRLPSSRPWPDPAAWLPDLPFATPDRVGLRD
jgi:hypothetical protein